MLSTRHVLSVVQADLRKWCHSNRNILKMMPSYKCKRKYRRFSSYKHPVIRLLCHRRTLVLFLKDPLQSIEFSSDTKIFGKKYLNFSKSTKRPFYQNRIQCSSNWLRIWSKWIFLARRWNNKRCYLRHKSTIRTNFLNSWWTYTFIL